MKSLKPCLLLTALLLALPLSLHAQLSAEQRVFDFQNLVALYSKRYAPYDWKRAAFGFDLLDIKSWVDRVRAAKSDLEFFEIEAEYVGRLQDTHSGFQMTSSFRAFLGMTVDIYDGKVLIDSITRSQLPAATYPFQIGDELVSVDGVSSEDWIKRISTWRQYGNPVTTRRTAAQQITFRVQATFPRAIEIGDTAAVEIRRASGALERYTIRWSKSGVPFTVVGPVPMPQPAMTLDQPAKDSTYLEGIDDLHHYELPANDFIRGYVNGVGSLAPVFRAGFPSNFVQRLGRSAADFHYSGTYTANGATFGYLRIPNFAPSSTVATVLELRAEIDFMQKNTDALVVDVTRDPGGGCYMIDVAAALIPYPFYFFGEQIRATQDRLNAFQAQLEIAQLTGANAGVIATYQSFIDQVKAALLANRGITAPIPACRQVQQTSAPTMVNNDPSPIVYTKPIIVLIDEFSISAADIFPSMIQDNKRAILVGMRSSGGGGSVSGWPTGFYSESLSTNTNTLVVRKKPIITPDFPAAPYVENIGARPDIALDLMTRDNLLTGGRAYVDQFTQIVGDEIRKAASRTPFTIPANGVISLATAGASGQPIIGYGRIEPNGSSNAPSGLAIFGLRQNNVLVTEATVPATAAIQTGRIYAEISGSVNTGVAIANPNNAPVTISFFFTSAAGNSNTGSTTIPANGQLAAFLDQAPFNASKPLAGTFTFTASAPVAVTALRGLNNERGEFLITTLQVVNLSLTSTTGAVVFPHYADGGGWTTQIALVNPTDNPISGVVQFLDQQGVTISTTEYAIPARWSQSIKTPGSAATTQTGSVRVLPNFTNPSPGGVAIFSFKRDGITVTEAGVPAISAGSTFRVYVETAGDFDRGAIGSVQSGLAITNLSNSQATVTIDPRKLDGSSAGAAVTITIPANGQTSAFLNQIAGLAALPQPFRGLLRISSTASISVVGLRGRYNERSDFLLTTTAPANEATAAGDDDLFFPQFAEAGGYSTQFILFSGTNATASGILRLTSQAGAPITLTLQ